MKDNINYMEDFDVYYRGEIADGSEMSATRNKWYKITCLLSLKDYPRKNTYFIPHPRLEEFLRYNPEKLIDIEPIHLEDVINVLGNNK